MWILASICVVLLLCVLLRLLWRKTLYGKAASIIDEKFPGPPAIPIFGNSLQVKSDPVEITEQLYGWYKRYGSPNRIKFGPFALVQIFQADQVEALLKSNTNITKSRDYDMISDWLGRGLLTSTGPRWFRKRKLLTPAFHFQILKDFLPIYNEQAENLVRILKTEAARNEPFDISSLLSLCTLDIICETAMGKRLGAMSNANSDYVNAVKEYSEATLQRGFQPWLWIPWVFYYVSFIGRNARKQLKILHEFTWTVIKEREALNIELPNPSAINLEETAEVFGKKKRRLAFLDLLLDMKRKGEMDTDEIREEVDTFMFEGHDTTATGLMWAIYCIGHNPQCQKLIQEELDSIMGPDLTEFPTTDQLIEMKYLECCIKESQRLYPSVPFIERRITQQLKLDEMYTVPEGTVLGVDIVNLHRDPQHFPDPMKYDPERFFPENSVGRHPFAFAPFSAGPRNCIGQKFALMEEKVILCHILRNFWVESLVPHDEIAPAILLVFRPTKGILVRLTPRE